MEWKGCIQVLLPGPIFGVDENELTGSNNAWKASDR